MFERFYIEKIDDEGTTYEIRIKFQNNTFKLDDIGIKPKRKRNFTYVNASVRDDWDYRKLDTEGRKQFLLEKLKDSCSIELINEALLEAWEQSKPELLK